MATSIPALRMGAGILLLFILISPSVAAQAPAIPSSPQGLVVAFSVECPVQFLTATRGTFADVTCTVRDLTRDSPTLPGSTPSAVLVPHVVHLDVTNQSVPGSAGWMVQIGRPDIPMIGGGSEPVTIRVSPTVTVAVPEYSFDIIANYSAGASGQGATQTLHFGAQVQRFDFVDVQIGGGKSVQTTGQNQIVSFPMEITNLGVYPDVYNVLATSSEPSVKVSNPGTVYVGPHEKRTVNVTAITPHDKLLELGMNAQIKIRVSSVSGTFTDSRSGSLQIRGPYVAAYWIPVSILVLISGVIVTRRAREAAQIRALERGRPRRPRPTPRQAVLLAELKRQDKARYQQRVAADQAVYKERRGTWLAAYRERRAKDRAESREARREFKKARAAQKAARVEQVRQRKEARLAERDAKKEERQKAKLLAKKRKQLEKEKSKLDAKQAKIDAKQAKIDAKHAAAQAKIDAKAAKAAEKAAKAEAKAAKKTKKRDGDA